ncbi:MAG TPA: GNAT family N-acetyltransferase [Microvirga sp.]|jgi:predicted GNAT family acetyltransferase
MAQGVTMADAFQDDQARNRFELAVGGQVAFARYARQGSKLAILHVEAPPALRGTGAAGRLMAAVAETARREGLTLLPYCGYAATWLRRHREYADLVG